MLDHRLPWYVAGPVLAACVIACRALFNGRLGVTGGFSELVSRVRRRSLAFDWRGWFALGIVAGGGLFALLRGGRGSEDYGWLSRALHGHPAAIALILLAAGALIGFGAKTAGGCTSGNGLTGTSMRSPASLAATATFFATAIAVSFVIEAVT